MSATSSGSKTGAQVEALVPERRQLGRYEIKYRVARGGMATVYLARLSATQGFSKWVAIKTIHAHVSDDPKYIGMFLDEARLAARINHPNVCSVFDFGESDGTYYLAMEYLHGQALSAVIRRGMQRGTTDTAIGARIVADAARGLHAAHELRDEQGNFAGVVHRDVSPQNIFVLYDGIAKVVDFGIAKSNDQTSEQTHTAELKGKVAYMAPEQISRAVVDRRADVWALGVVLWEATVGRRLFQRTSEIATLNAVAYEPVPLPSSMREGYPAALEAVVMRALERDPDRRYQTAAEIARDLEIYLAMLPAPVMNAEVATFMSANFEEEIVERNEALREHDRGVKKPGRAARTTPSKATPPPPPHSPIAGVTQRGYAVPGPTPVNTAPTPVSEAPVVIFASANDAAPNVKAAESLNAQRGAQLAPMPTPYADADPATASTARAELRKRLFVIVGLAAFGVLAGIGVATIRNTGRPTSTAPVPVAPNTPARPAPVAVDAGFAHTNAIEQDASTPSIPPPHVVVNTHPTHVTAPVIRPTPPSTTGPTASSSHNASSNNTHAQTSSHTTTATGSLNLLAVPSARVFERGRSLGMTPLVQFQMTAGSHALRLVPTDGRPARTITVTIREGQATPHREVW